MLPDGYSIVGLFACVIVNSVWKNNTKSVTNFVHPGNPITGGSQTINCRTHKVYTHECNRINKSINTRFKYVVFFFPISLSLRSFQSRHFGGKFSFSTQVQCTESGQINMNVMRLSYILATLYNWR